MREELGRAVSGVLLGSSRSRGIAIRTEGLERGLRDGVTGGGERWTTEREWVVCSTSVVQAWMSIIGRAEAGVAGERVAARGDDAMTDVCRAWWMMAT